VGIKNLDSIMQMTQVDAVMIGGTLRFHAVSARRSIQPDY
jgi:hypothetical protein